MNKLKLFVKEVRYFISGVALTLAAQVAADNLADRIWIVFAALGIGVCLSTVVYVVIDLEYEPDPEIKILKERLKKYE